MFKNILLLLAILTATGSVGAQNIYFSFKDGSQAVYLLTDIRSVTFTGDVFNLNKNNGSTVTWNISTIDNYRYDASTVNIREIENTAEVLIYPNPSQGKVTISYTMPKVEQVGINIYDLSGRLVKTWDVGQQAAGSHEITWQANGLTKGSYLLRFTTTKGSFTKTIILQ